MKCLHCASENPDSATRCDCGYDFQTGEFEASCAPPEQLASSWATALILGGLGSFLVAGGFLGFVALPAAAAGVVVAVVACRERPWWRPALGVVLGLAAAGLAVLMMSLR